MTILFCLGIIGAATADVMNQDSEDEMTNGAAMILNGSQKMIAAEKILNEAKQMARDGQNLTKAREMISEAERLSAEGERMWELGQAIVDRQEQAQKKMTPIMQRRGHNHESRIVAIGMKVAEAMLVENPKVSRKNLQTVTDR